MIYLRHLAYVLIWYLILLIPFPGVSDDIKFTTVAIGFPISIWLIEYYYFSSIRRFILIQNFTSCLILCFFGMVQMRLNHSYCAWFEVIVFAWLVGFFITYLTLYLTLIQNKFFKGIFFPLLNLGFWLIWTFISAM